MRTASLPANLARLRSGVAELARELAAAMPIVILVRGVLSNRAAAAARRLDAPAPRKAAAALVESSQ
jgi:hypothetical protein